MDTPEGTSSLSVVLALGALAVGVWAIRQPSPGALALGALAPLFTPKRFLLEHNVSLKFLILGPMGFTQAVTGPFTEGEQLW